jgi:hypothetical protein
MDERFLSRAKKKNFKKKMQKKKPETVTFFLVLPQRNETLAGISYLHVRMSKSFPGSSPRFSFLVCL